MGEKVKTKLILKHNDVNIPLILNYRASEITHQILYQKVRESLSSYGFVLRDVHLSLNGKTIIPNDAKPITSSGIVSGDILIILNMSKFKKFGNDKSQSIFHNTINDHDLLLTQTTISNTADTNILDESKIVSLSHSISNNLILTAIYNLQSKKCGKCYELLLIAVHVMMLELGYLPIFKKTSQFQSSKGYLLNTAKNFPNNYVLPSGWDSSNGFYNLSYWHPAAELLYCKLVCVPLNDSLIIHAMIEGDDIMIDQDMNSIKDKSEDADSCKPSQKVEDTAFFQTLFDNLPLLREDKGRLGFVLTNIFSKSLLSLTLDLRDFIENYDKHSLKPIPLLPSATNASTSSNEDGTLLYTDVAYQLGHCYKNLAKLSTNFKDTLGWPLLYDTMLRNGLVAIIQANKSYFAEHHFKNNRETSASDKKNFEQPEAYECSGIPSRMAEQTSASVLHWLRSMPSYVLYAARHNYGLPTFNASALPPEIKSKILLELTLGINPEPRHLVRVSGINREFYALARQQSLWKRLCLIDFPDLATTFPDQASSREATPSPSNSSTTTTSDNNAASDSIDWYVMYAERYKLRVKYTALARARANAVEHGAVRMRRLLPPPIPFHRHPHHNRYPPFYPMFPPYGPPFNHAIYPLNHENFWPAPCNSRDGAAWPYHIAHHSDPDLGVDFDDGVVRRPLLNSGGAGGLGGVVVTSHPGANTLSSPPAADATIRSIPVRFATTSQRREENGVGSDQYFVIRDRTRPLPPLYYLCGGVDHPDPTPPDSENDLTVTSASDPATLSNLLNVNSLINTHQTHANLPVSIYFPPNSSHAQNTYFSFMP